MMLKVIKIDLISERLYRLMKVVAALLYVIVNKAYKKTL